MFDGDKPGLGDLPKLMAMLERETASLRMLDGDADGTPPNTMKLCRRAWPVLVEFMAVTESGPPGSLTKEIAYEIIDRHGGEVAVSIYMHALASTAHKLSEAAASLRAIRFADTGE
jgi:hypothetical protein